MSLIELYNEALQQPDMVHDGAQEEAISKLAALTEALISKPETTFVDSFIGWLKPFYSSISRHPQATEQPIQGLYLWGGVGRGKTWLMNLFYEELPITEKKRIHFHHFMLDIHARLDELNKSKQSRKKNPLKQVGRDIAEKYRVLCIDEFIVTNITDAMILSELLHALFEHGVCLVATSNRVPDDLYLNGLQRDRFLPAIELIKTHTEVFHLDGGLDHRLALLELSDIYYSPLEDDTDRQINQRISELAITPLVDNKIITVLDREIVTIRCSEEIAWFDFTVICSSPRAAQDYIELARRFGTIVVSDIPMMDEYSDDKARRFIYLIDELYDRNVTFIASAEASPDKLYQGDMLEFAFHRTSSRLIEMHSHQYLSRSHRPY